jgi:PAS domain S-box-containing protein
MRLLMKETLIDGDYTIEEFDNGHDTMIAIRQSEPDMILLDVKMPGMSGFDVCNAIREHNDASNISVVMVTGLDDFESIEKAFQLGATAFINKPINWITFPYQVQYLLKARKAFVSVKQREVRLEHMERISRTLTQSKDRDVILKDVMHEMLDILSADRACILNTRHEDNSLELVSIATRENCCNSNGNEKAFLFNIDPVQLIRARNSEFPQISSYPHSDHDPDFQVRHQMMRALHHEDGRTWFLLIQQCNDTAEWTGLEHETFYRICIRLGTVLSRYLLTERLHYSEYLLRQAQRIGRIGNWRLQLNTGELIWSDEVFRIFGYEPASFMPDDEKFYAVVFEEDFERVSQFRHSALHTGETHSIEYRIKLPDGEIRWVHEQCVGDFDGEIDLTVVNGTVQDITDRRKKQEQEVHDNKMEAIGQLTSGVAHDFGNLMTIAKGNLELLDEMLKDTISGEAMEILEDARSAIQDGVELTRQLLAISRKKSLVANYIDLGSSVTSFSKLLKNTLGDNINLVIDINPDLPDILVDSAQFESSLLNVVINARDAMPDGGELLIHAEQVDTLSTETSSDSDIASNQQVLLTIADNGTGMSSSVLQHAIEPFYTTKNNGTGLGLSMVYGFMRQSGGELEIDSSPGKGTALRMRFPVHGGKCEKITLIPDSKANRLYAETVLVVEDRPAVRQFAVRCLEQLGLKIIETDNADTAQGIITSGVSINLLFTDILMPGNMNGRDLATWTSKHYPGIKILLTTASERQAMKVSSDNEQIFQILQKPYGKLELISKIEDIL